MDFAPTLGIELNLRLSDTHPKPVVPARPKLWQVKHDRDLGALWRPNLPEVHPFLPNHFVPFPEPWQRLSYSMNTTSKAKWTSVYGDTTVIANENGFGNDDDPRANYITGENLREPLPKVEALVCGGAVLTGTVVGDSLAVQTLNGRGAPPAIDWLMERPWYYFHAVTVDGGGVPRMFPQGGGLPVLLPLMADRTRFPVLTFPLSKLRKLADNEPIPSPYA